MKQILQALSRAAQKAVGVIKRFITNDPRNEYEIIAFSAIRGFALVFGRA